jgi:KDO2-lipid IV(A) lauroyltransferase
MSILVSGFSLLSMNKHRRLRHWIEYLPAWLLLKVLGLLPRRWALRAGYAAGALAYRFWPRLRPVGQRNLELVFPELSHSERDRILKGAFRNLGRLLGEFSQFPKHTSATISQIVEYDGLEHYTQAVAQGRGVLILTAHFGAWELSSFAHSMYGYPMRFLARRLDNPLLENLIEQYRTLGGNRSVDKTQAARQVLRALKQGETIGILMDLNTQTQEGIFCDFFGISACTSPLVAAFALRSLTPVVPGFLIWDEQRQKHRLRFDPPVELIITGDQHYDIVANTSRFNQIIETHIRRYPEHWLWVHKRWNTQPEGKPSLYGR